MKSVKRNIKYPDLFKDIKIDIPKTDAEIKAEMFKAIQAKDYQTLENDDTESNSKMKFWN